MICLNNIQPGGVLVVLGQSVYTKYLYNINFVQCWTNVEDVGPALYKCFVFTGSAQAEDWRDASHNNSFNVW